MGFISPTKETSLGTTNYFDGLKGGTTEIAGDATSAICWVSDSWALHGPIISVPCLWYHRNNRWLPLREVLNLVFFSLTILMPYSCHHQIDPSTPKSYSAELHVPASRHILRLFLGFTVKLLSVHYSSCARLIVVLLCSCLCRYGQMVPLWWALLTFWCLCFMYIPFPF